VYPVLPGNEHLRKQNRTNKQKDGHTDTDEDEIGHENEKDLTWLSQKLHFPKTGRIAKNEKGKVKQLKPAKNKQTSSHSSIQVESEQIAEHDRCSGEWDEVIEEPTQVQHAESE
jgi:hypothetical protein